MRLRYTIAAIALAVAAGTLAGRATVDAHCEPPSLKDHAPRLLMHSEIPAAGSPLPASIGSPWGRKPTTVAGVTQLYWDAEDADGIDRVLEVTVDADGLIVDAHLLR